MTKPTWKDLYDFIQDKIAKEGPEFLENKLYIECQSPETINKSFETITDSEGWVYSEPAWSCGDKVHVFSTTFEEEKIVTLNINY